MPGKPTYEELERRVAELQKEAIHREETEKALRESEERYRNFVVNASEGIYRVDFTAPIVVDVPDKDLVASISKHAIVGEVNDALARMYGLQARDMIGRPATDFAPDYGERAVLAVRAPRNQVRNIETLDVDKEGNPIYLSESYTAVVENGVLVRIWGMQRDRTVRKQAEETLEENKNFIDKIINTAPNLVYIYDLVENRNVYSNAGIEKLLGFTVKEIQEMGALVFPILLHPDDVHKVSPHHDTLKKSQDGEIFEIDYRMKNSEGEYRTLRSWDTVFKRGKDGTAQQIIGLAVDVTEQIKTEKSLQFEKERAQQYLDVAGVILVALDKEGKVSLINRKGCEILGWPQEEIVGKDWFATFLFSENVQEIKAVFDQAISGNVEPAKYHENPIRTRDGGSRLIAWHNSILKDSSGNIIGLFSSGEDITDRRYAEEALRESEEKLARSRKMEAMGLMAGGVAHDLNNILSGMVSYPELILMDLPEDSPLRKPIMTIQESGMKAADVVADLLTIAKGVAIGKEVLNLNTIATEYLGSPEYRQLVMRHSFVDYKIDLSPELLNIKGSATHIKKSLMNLVINASEAIEGNGTVTISTASRYLDEPVKGYEDVCVGEYAVLAVSDDGSGIFHQDLERIFEPFYTKKIMGRSGTGLGLAVVWNTVQDHDGYIDVKSMDNSTIFELYFPVTREEAPDEKEELPIEDYLGQGETILVVDDEERQREIACMTLEKLGYNAEAVSRGEEGLEYVKEHPVDLILLDMVMPEGINGRETYEEIIKIRPGQKAVIASGYAKTKEVVIAQELGAGKYVKKPYTLSNIGPAIKEELEK
ncbi:MAG: PAS domain S-box protein [Deltaproteobacteria bacterium]|nr:PAS domain S-box protein [Deltaproteobacteria bacterium]